MDAIQVQNVKKTYPKFQMDSVSFTLPEGYIMGLIGENGAGKSTLIKMMLDMSYTDAGSIKLMGKDSHADAVGLKEDLGIVLDTIGAPSVFNVRDLNQSLKRIYQNWDEQLFFTYVETFQLPEKKVLKTFSMGMQKKLGIAMALAHHPKLLILDEITAGLDPMMRDDFLELLQEFVSDGKHSVLMSSHIISDLEKVCDYVTFLHQGSVLFSMEKDALLEEYAMVRCSTEDAQALPEESICAKRSHAYGAEVLVKRNAAPNWAATDAVSIEEIMVLLSKYGVH